MLGSYSASPHLSARAMPPKLRRVKIKVVDLLILKVFSTRAGNERLEAECQVKDAQKKGVRVMSYKAKVRGSPAEQSMLGDI